MSRSWENKIDRRVQRRYEKKISNRERNDALNTQSRTFNGENVDLLQIVRKKSYYFESLAV